MTFRKKLLVATLLALACESMGTAGTYDQSTSRLQLKWGNGRLISYRDRTNGREWLATSSIPVRLLVFGENAPELKPAPELRWLKTETVGSQTLVHHYRAEVPAMHYANRTFAPATVDLRLTVTVRNAESVWHADWQSSAELPLAEVRAPLLPVSRVLGTEAADDVLAAPWMDGQLYRAPGLRSQPPMKLSNYPGPFSAQFAALYDKTCGLLLWTPDANGWMKRFVLEPGSSAFTMGLGNYVSGFGARSWKQPYPVRISGFKGDWYDAADIYAEWAHRQVWCRRTVRERDYARMVREPYVFVQDIAQWWQPRTAEAFASRARKYSKMTGSPVAINFFGWEQHGVWVANDYFPPFGGQEFRAGAELARKDGNAVFAFLSGFRFTRKSLPKSRLKVDFENEWEKLQRDIGCWWWDGTVEAEDTSWGLRNSRLNIASAAARKRMADYFLKGPRWGISMMQLDQDVALMLGTSWYQPDGTIAGYSNVAANRAREFLTAVRRQGRTLDPDFTLTMERPNEFVIQELDLAHTRLYDSAAAPIFAYMYHEYQAGYSGWTDLPGKFPGVDENLYALARSVCGGQIIGVRANRLSAAFSRQVAEAATFQKDRGNKFLIGGRMLPVPEIKGVTNITGDRQVRPDLKPVRGRVESVVSGAFEAPDGSLGLLLCNVTGSPADLTINPARWRKTGQFRFSQRRLRDPNFPSTASVATAPGPVKAIVPSGEFLWLEWQRQK